MRGVEFGGNLESMPRKELSEYGLPVMQKYSNERLKVKITECAKEGIDWRHLLNKQNTEILEIGGPTFHFIETDIINFNDYADRLVRTNISHDFRLKNPMGEIVEAKEYVDVIMDAEKLGFPDETFGSVFVKNFRIADTQRKMPKPKPMEFDRENTQHISIVADEAWRVLHEGGLLVWINLEKPDFQEIVHKGFDLVFYQLKESQGEGTFSNKRYSAVFVKNKKVNSEM